VFKVQVIDADKQVHYTSVNTRNEMERLIALSNADGLYFDGEYFFEVPPVNTTAFRCKIVQVKQIKCAEIGGGKSMVCLLVCFFVLAWFYHKD